MAINDISVYDEAIVLPGSKEFKVAAGATVINTGEPVAKQLGTSGTSVAALATSKPLVGTDYLAGIATSTSTNTSLAAGIVEVTPVSSPNVTFLCAAKTSTDVDSQAKYDALVGSRVTLDLTSTTYTVNTTDSSGNGLVIEPLDITRFPGKIRFSVRAGASYLA